MPTIHKFRRLALPGAIALCTILASVAGTAAGMRGEKAYADSFGNLVVLSPAGYKRIVVGRGYLAHRMQATRNEGPKVVYLDREGETARSCHHHAVLLHGRSYMYGLPDGVVPEPSSACW